MPALPSTLPVLVARRTLRRGRRDRLSYQCDGRSAEVDVECSGAELRIRARPKVPVAGIGAWRAALRLLAMLHPTATQVVLDPALTRKRVRRRLTLPRLTVPGVAPALLQVARAAPTPAAYLDALLTRAMDRTAPQRIHFLANRDAAQDMGSILTLRELDSDLFIAHVAPRLREGYAESVEAYRDKHPDMAALLRGSDVLMIRTRDEIRTYLAERFLAGWAFPESLAGDLRFLPDGVLDLTPSAVWSAAHTR